MWMSSPQPTVTLVKTIDVSRLRKVSRKRGLKFNMLLCWCIGKAASRIDETFLLPADGKMFQYDSLAINVIVPNKKGGISSCDVPLPLSLKKNKASSKSNHKKRGCAEIGTSSFVLIQFETDRQCVCCLYPFTVLTSGIPSWHVAHHVNGFFL